MDKLAKICEVLALKRSRAEQKVAESEILLKALDKHVAAMEIKISNISANVLSGAALGDPIREAITLEKWRDMTLADIRTLNIQRKDIINRLSADKERLKETLIKEDIVNNQLKAKRRSHEQSRLESESSARLENWVVSKF